MSASVFFSASACNAILDIGDPTIVPNEVIDAADSNATPDVADEPPVEPDASAGSSTCAHGSPFQAPTPVRGLEDLAVIGARFNKTESNVYLSLFVDGGMDIFLAGRATRSDSFGPLSKLSVSTPGDDYWPTLDADERVMFLESGSDQTQFSPSRIWFTSRDSTKEDFRKATLSTFFSNLPPGAVDSAPYLVPSGNALYFVSTGRADNHVDPPIANAPSQDIWAIETNEFGTAISSRRLSEISTDEDTEQFPVVTADGREIFFTRTLFQDFNDDIWVAQRDAGNVAAIFNAPARVDDGAGPVNSVDAREWASWISPDNCRLYFLRTPKVVSLADTRLWVAERAKP